MFANLPDSPQGIGDIIGLAARHTRANFRVIFSFLIVPTIFAAASATATQWAFSSGLSSVLQSKSPGNAVELGLIWFGGIIVLLLAWWVLSMRLFALVRWMLGFSPDLEDAKKNLYAKKWRMAGVYFLSVVMLLAALCAFAVFGFFSGMMAGTASSVVAALGALVFFVGSFVSGVVFALTMHIAFCILACEEEGAVNVVGRSLSLVFRHFWRSAAFGIVFLVTFSLISYPLTLPAVLVAVGDGFMHGMAVSKGQVPSGSYQPPLWTLVFAEFWTSIAWMYLRPFTAFAFGLLYYDFRLRSEGLDIGRKMELALPLYAAEVER